VSLHEPALEEARYLLSPDVIDPLLERPYTRQTEHNANVACSRSFFHCAQPGTQISGYVVRAGMSQGSTDRIAHVRSLLTAVIGSESGGSPRPGRLIPKIRTGLGPRIQYRFTPPSTLFWCVGHVRTRMARFGQSVKALTDAVKWFEAFGMLGSGT